jgi:hypothetical protein
MATSLDKAQCFQSGPIYRAIGTVRGPETSFTKINLFLPVSRLLTAINGLAGAAAIVLRGESFRRWIGFQAAGALALDRR